MRLFYSGYYFEYLVRFKACYEREQLYKPRILLPTAAPPVFAPAERSAVADFTGGFSVSPVNTSMPPSFPSSRPNVADDGEDDDFTLTKDVRSTSPASLTPPTPQGPEPKFLGSVASSSDAAMEDDTQASMSTSSLSPVPADNDNKPGRNT